MSLITINFNVAGVADAEKRLAELERKMSEQNDTYDSVKAALEELQSTHAKEKQEASERFAAYDVNVQELKNSNAALVARVEELEARGPQLLTQEQLNELGGLARDAKASGAAIVDPLNPPNPPAGEDEIGDVDPVR